MKTYHFRTNEFGLSDTGIHFLRSGFNYKTISFHEIHKADIKKGKELHNWVAIFIIGIVLLLPGLYYAGSFINLVLNDDLSPRDARMVFLLLIPAVGTYFIYSSLKTGTILQIHYGNDKTDKFPLRDIANSNSLPEFESLLKDKLPAKLTVR